MLKGLKGFFGSYDRLCSVGSYLHFEVVGLNISLGVGGYKTNELADMIFTALFISLDIFIRNSSHSGG